MVPDIKMFEPELARQEEAAEKARAEADETRRSLEKATAKRRGLAEAAVKTMTVLCVTMTVLCVTMTVLCAPDHDCLGSTGGGCGEGARGSR